MSASPTSADQLTPLQRALLGIRELRAQMDQQRRARTEPIAVIGLGCRLPGGADDADSFWRLLREGADVITEMPADRWDVDAYYDPDPDAPGRMNTRWGGFLEGIDQFDPAFFGISPWEAANMDPQQRLMLEVVQEALDDAGQVRDRLAGSRTGVFIGLAHSEYGWLNFNNPELANVYTATGSFGSIVANRVSYLYDLRGPSYTVDAVCSSSLLAVHQACESLRAGDCTMALAGGAGLLLKPEGFVWFSKLGVMAADGRCKAFDARGDGIVLGEGVAAIVLKPLSRALADGDPIHAVLRGGAVAQDGRSNGLTAPSRLAQEAMLREAYQRAEVDPRAVQYVEAHGTGTVLGDPIEAQALGTVMGAGRDQPLRIGSVKTNIGHLQMLGGLAGLLKVVLAMKHRELPPSLHFTKANPYIPFDDYRLRVQDQLGPWPAGGPLLAAVTSLSFGGTNVHMIVEEAPRPAAAPPPAIPGDEPARLLPLSAHTLEALRELAGAYQQFVADPGVDLDDLCYTASLRRDHHDERAAIPFTSRADLVRRLAALRDGQARPGTSRGGKAQRQRRKLVFAFPGQGGQWIGMGRRLLDQEPAFRQALDECEAAMSPHVTWSLLAELRADEAGSRLGEIDVVQPVTWAVQVALAALWRSWGVVPDAVVGQSMGEVAAAHVAGALGMEDAARVICLRSQLVRRIRGRGTMAVVELPLDQARAAIAEHGERLAVAVSSSPTSTVLSGDNDAIEDVLRSLDELGVFGRRVNVDFASHSPHVDVLRADLLAALRDVRPGTATVPVYSTVTGQPTDGHEFTADYWARNLREPVLFATAVQRLIGSGHTLFIEISPHPILLPAIEQSARYHGTEAVTLPSLRRDEDERAVLLGTLGALHTTGRRVDWRRQHPADRAVLRLPRYPWQRQRCWLEFGSAGPPARAGAAGGQRYFRAAAAGAEHFWELPLDHGCWPTLEDHRVRGAVRLPEAALLDLALSAGKTLFQAPSCVLAGVTIGPPVPVAPGRVAQVAVGGVREGSADWQVFSGDTGDGTEWTRHAHGTLRPATGTPYVDPQDMPDAVRARCVTEIPGTAYHQSRAAAGLTDGAAFRAVQRVWRRDGELLALLGSKATNGRGPLDWHLLHSAFGLLAVVAPSGTDPAATHRPAAIERLYVAGRAVDQGATPATEQEQLWVHARLREVGAGTLVGDIRLLDAELLVVAEASGLRLCPAGRGHADQDAGHADLPAITTAAPAAALAPAALGSGGLGSGGLGSGGLDPAVSDLNGAAPTSRAALLEIAPARRRDMLTAYLRGEIAAVLGLGAGELPLDQPLLGLGLNSLMTFELRNRLRVMYRTRIDAERFLAGITVAAIIDQVLAQVDTAAPTPTAPVRQADPPARTQPQHAPVSTDPADWVVGAGTETPARMRLFCLPYAGGNASVFHTWGGGLPAEVEVCPIQLPGREQRYRERPFTQVAALTTALTQALAGYLDRPFAIFGHSMGALVGFEFARRLRREGRQCPIRLYVSAARAPQLPDPEPPLHRLPEPALLQRLRAVNGTPERVLDDPETIGLYLPALRADFAVVETYIHQRDAPLDCPISAFRGAQDHKIAEDAVAAWGDQSAAEFTTHTLPGDHFFLNTSRAELLAVLSRQLKHDLDRLGETAPLTGR